MSGEKSLLQTRILRAPEFKAGEWLNSERPLTMAGLRGRAVLVDIWEYSCVNCIRTLPYLREWNRRYGQAELVFAEDLASRAAIALDNARLYHDAQAAVRLRHVHLQRLHRVARGLGVAALDVLDGMDADARLVPPSDGDVPVRIRQRKGSARPDVVRVVEGLIECRCIRGRGGDGEDGGEQDALEHESMYGANRCGLQLQSRS